MVRAHVDRGDLGATSGQTGAHRGVDRLKRPPREVAARDAGLIRHHDDRQVRPIEQGDRLGRPGQEMEILRPPAVMHVLGDCPVAVEKHGGSHLRTGWNAPAGQDVRQDVPDREVGIFELSHVLTGHDEAEVDQRFEVAAFEPG